MKTASIVLMLSKDHHVPLNNVTPIQTLLLVAEHHKNCGGCPIDIKDVTNVKDVTRTTDQECDRLRTIYAAKKVDAVLNQVRDLPDDFAKALERGIKVAMPTGSLITVQM